MSSRRRYHKLYRVTIQVIRDAESKLIRLYNCRQPLPNVFKQFHAGQWTSIIDLYNDGSKVTVQRVGRQKGLYPFNHTTLNE